MNLFKKILATVCFVVVCFGYGGQSWGADWTLYYQTETEDENKTTIEKYYYDRSSVERLQKNILKLTQKTTVQLKQNEEIDKRVIQMEMNCSSNKYRVLSQTEYDVATGKTIMEGQMESTTWKKFDINSLMGGLRDNLCYEQKQKKEPDKKQKKETEKKQEDKEPAK